MTIWACILPFFSLAEISLVSVIVMVYTNLGCFQILMIQVSFLGQFLLLVGGAMTPMSATGTAISSGAVIVCWIRLTLWCTVWKKPNVLKKCRVIKLTMSVLIWLQLITELYINRTTYWSRLGPQIMLKSVFLWIFVLIIH